MLIMVLGGTAAPTAPSVTIAPVRTVDSGKKLTDLAPIESGYRCTPVECNSAQTSRCFTVVCAAERWSQHSPDRSSSMSAASISRLGSEDTPVRTVVTSWTQIQRESYHLSVLTHRLPNKPMQLPEPAYLARAAAPDTLAWRSRGRLGPERLLVALRAILRALLMLMATL